MKYRFKCGGDKNAPIYRLSPLKQKSKFREFLEGAFVLSIMPVIAALIVISVLVVALFMLATFLPLIAIAGIIVFLSVAALLPTVFIQKIFGRSRR